LYGFETISCSKGTTYVDICQQSELNKEKVTHGWKKIHNEELHTLYSSPDIFNMIRLRKMKFLGHTAYMREMKNAQKILAGRSQEQIPLVRLI
jgi:hypothetical protein